MSIFKDFGSAFAAMYDETVAITGTRANGATVRGSFAACVFPAVLDPVLDENDATSNRITLEVSIPKCGSRAWNLTTPPQIGDAVTFDGKSFKITKVEPYPADDIKFTMREV